MKNYPHPLIEMVYRPRVIAHLGTGAIILSIIPDRAEPGWLLTLLAFSVGYPLLIYWLTRRWFLWPKTAEYTQLIDAFYSGLLCAAINLAALPVVSIVSALFISSMLLFGLMGCLFALICFSAGFSLYWLLNGIQFNADVNALTTIISGATVCMYGVTTSYIVYHRGQISNAGLVKIRTHHDRLQGVANQLSKYISPQIYRSISEANQPVTIRTERKKLTVFFSDIEGFTELTDNMEPEGLTLLLNEYLDEMARIVLDYGGTIDKFMGDGLMVFFGDPISRGCHEDALACVSMALQMRARMVQLRSKWAEEGISNPLHIRIGINTGFCTVGNFGSESRLDYTIIGSSVNIASRLEAAAGRDEILISNETFLLVRQQITCEQKPELSLKGIHRPVPVFQVSNLKSAQSHLFVRETAGFQLAMDTGIIETEQILQFLQETLAEAERLHLARIGYAKTHPSR